MAVIIGMDPHKRLPAETIAGLPPASAAHSHAHTSSTAGCAIKMSRPWIRKRNEDRG
jgi:hypothetical protein